MILKRSRLVDAEELWKMQPVAQAPREKKQHGTYLRKGGYFLCWDQPLKIRHPLPLPSGGSWSLKTFQLICHMESEFVCMEFDEVKVNQVLKKMAEIQESIDSIVHRG
ncbi:hypothetical protein JZ751_027599 [Albula glossodonta]|uniref:Uncharacterized protein n=1 Tax=Albula glossodonta TaxID=121402 RepID=A0A8T2NN23_9TELE|nr:hypothetical protein JZ751_027599 [Albula glossodonta]